MFAKYGLFQLYFEKKANKLSCFSENKIGLILIFFLIFFRKITLGHIFEDIFCTHLSKTRLQSKEYEIFKYTKNEN